MQRREFSAVEIAGAWAIVGSILAVAVPELSRSLRASPLAEPVRGLERIASAAVAYAKEHGTFPESAPLTPPEVPRGGRREDPPGVWQHPTWQALNFGFDYAHSFSFAFESREEAGVPTFVAVAHGDLDGDGVLSTFEVVGVVDEQGARVLPGMFVDREVE